MNTSTPASSQSRGLLHQLGQKTWLHRLLRLARAYPIANGLLKRLPLTRTLSDGLCYRLTSLDLFALEGELWRNGCYQPAIAGMEIRTFLDLGANVGWFPVWLAHAAGRTDLHGLLVEADPGCLAETSWHLEKNASHLSRCQLLHGAVGLPPGQTETSFSRYPSATQSSVLPHNDQHPIPLKGRIETVNVCAVRIAEEWPRAFPEEPVIDLLKLDIEGLELAFLTHEAAFVQQAVRRAVLEWHKWHVSLEQVNATFAAIGFSLTAILDQDNMVGTAIYDNQKFSQS